MATQRVRNFTSSLVVDGWSRFIVTRLAALFVDRACMVEGDFSLIAKQDITTAPMLTWVLSHGKLTSIRIGKLPCLSSHVGIADLWSKVDGHGVIVATTVRP